MVLIDSHMHVNFQGLSTKDIIKYLDKEKIECCWLLTWEEINPFPRGYQHLPVENVYDAYLQYPSRIIPFYAPDPLRIDAVAELENWYGKGIRGCGELKSIASWDSDEINSLLQVLRRLKMPLVFHMEESEQCDIPYSNAIYDRLIFYGFKKRKDIFKIPQKVLNILFSNFAPLRNRTRSYAFPGYMLDFASLETALQNYPEINFIAHGPMFWKNISADAPFRSEAFPKGLVNDEGIIWRLLKEYPNLFADISGDSGLNALSRDPQNAKKFLTVFEDKILYATDNFFMGQRDFLNSLGLSKNSYEKVYGENACHLINNK